MSVDISTLVLLTIAVCYGLGGICLLLSFHRSGARGSRHWGRGLLVLGAGYTLLYLYPTLGMPVVYAGWLCILLAALVMYRALLRITGSDAHRTRFGVMVVGATVLAWLYFGLVSPDPLRQMDATHLAFGIIGARAAWDVGRHALRSRFRAPAIAVAVGLSLSAARPIFEAIGREIHGDNLGDLPLFGPPALVFLRVVVMTLLTISVIWMEVARLYEAVDDQAMHDELTGIANRRAILELLGRELARAKREGTTFSIAIFDIDYFKRINDTHGHAAGDQVLRWVTNVIGNSIRPYDVLARYGGEEFLLLMPGAGPEAGAAVASRARLAIKNGECFADNKRLQITVSAGVANWSKDLDSDTLLRSADQMLYRAKEAGRNRVELAERAPTPVASTA